MTALPSSLQAAQLLAVFTPFTALQRPAPANNDIPAGAVETITPTPGLREQTGCRPGLLSQVRAPKGHSPSFVAAVHAGAEIMGQFGSALIVAQLFGVAGRGITLPR